MHRGLRGRHLGRRARGRSGFSFTPPQTPTPPPRRRTTRGPSRSARSILGASTPDAWKSLGLDIDGQASTRTSTGVCQLAQGAPPSTHDDGDGGIDNSFGANLVPVLTTVMGSDVIAQMNASFAAGEPVNILGVHGLAAAGGDATLLGTFDSMPFDTAWLTNGIVVGGPSALETQLTLGRVTSGSRSAELVLPITHVQVVAPLADAGWSVQGGVLSGILPTEEAVSAVVTFATAMKPGIDSQTLTVFEDAVRQASDILVDGTQDPTKACDGISIGLGFTAEGHPSFLDPHLPASLGRPLPVESSVQP